MFDPREFHAFAVRCAAAATDEATCRSAISRSYYAAYLVAFAYVKEHGLQAVPRPGQRWGPHERTIHAIEAIRHPGAGFIGELLAKLKRDRIDADYHPEFAQAQLLMPRAIRDAAIIIAWIDDLP